MCYARRQRSSWARIKLSSKLYLNLSVKTLFVELVWLFILCWVCLKSVIDLRFLFQRNFEILNHKLCLYFNLLLFNCQWSAADSSALSRVLRDLIIIPHPWPFVKRFLKSFLSFFQELFSTAFQPERKCLSIIPHSLAFVKRFFKSFFKNFFNRFSAGAEVPKYYITSSRVCQEVFQKFFQLFSWFFSRPSLAVARSLTACIL